MKQAWVRVLLWIAVGLTAAMIFGFSGQDGDASMGMSDRVVIPVVTWVHQNDPAIPMQRLEALYWTLQTIIRKGAHLTEFALLGFWLRLLCASYAWPKAWLLAWGAGTLYAAADEFHQLFSAGRCAQWTDVLIDSTGAAIGTLAAAGILRLYEKRRNKRC